MGGARYLAVALVAAGVLVFVEGPARAGDWENDPAKLCEMPLLVKEAALTDEQQEEIEPILKELGRELQRWNWRNDAKYNELEKAFAAAVKARKTDQACELMNKKKALEVDRKTLVDRFKRKIISSLEPEQRGRLEGYTLGREMLARNSRWRLSAEQREQVRQACYAQGRMISDFRERADLRSLAKAQVSLQTYIVKNIFTDAQRERLEAPVRPKARPRTEEEITEEQKERVRIAVDIWAGKRHMEEVKRSQKITQQMTDMMVEHNIRMANKAWEDFQRRLQRNRNRKVRTGGSRPKRGGTP